MRLRNQLIKTKKAAKSELLSVEELRKGYSSYKAKGTFEIQDIFYMFVVGLMVFVFIQIWNPILAMFNFTGMAYGSIVELLLNIFVLIIVAGYLASMIKKWQTPSM
jgi:hypothetical protein